MPSASNRAVRMFGQWCVILDWSTEPVEIQLREQKGKPSSTRMMLASVRSATKLEIAQAEGKR